jgi:hypothetical protein
MSTEAEFPDEAIKRAWARAFRHTETPIGSHDDARVIALPGGVVATIAVDERDGQRFARVSVGRGTGEPLDHDAAVPLVARVFLLGRFEPFPVESAIGADGATLHYVIDLEAYKQAKTQDHIAAAVKLTGASTAGAPHESAGRGGGEGSPASLSDAEIAAIQLTVPLWALARTWDQAKAEARDPRTIVFLSDRFLVPRPWIEFQIEHFFAELAEGAIDEQGRPTTRGDAS